MQSIPRGLKPQVLCGFGGTAKAVPFQNLIYATSSRAMRVYAASFRVVRSVPVWVLICLMVLAQTATPRCESQAPDSFRWIDFHAPKDQDVVVWVTRALDGQKWTAIREIGVQYDAALVITSFRANPQSAANEDVFTVWSVSLSDRSLTSILKGTNLRVVEWMLFVTGGLRELGVMYDDCNNCAATTFFTAFYYDLRGHTWAARWMRGGQGVPLWVSNATAEVTRTQVYAMMADPNGRETLGTWNHLDYGRQKPAEDFVYRYDLDQGERARADAVAGWTGCCGHEGTPLPCPGFRCGIEPRAGFLSLPGGEEAELGAQACDHASSQ